MTKDQLLFITCWIESPQQTQIQSLSLSINKKPYITRKKYISGQKIYAFDIVQEKEIPPITIICQQQTINLNIMAYQIPTSSPIIRQIKTKLTLNVLAEILTNADKIYDKYCCQRIDEQKRSYCLGIQHLIRSQAQFLSSFQKDKQIDNLKDSQVQQRKIEQQLSQKIANIQKIKISSHKIVFCVILFIIIGLISGKMFQSQHEEDLDKANEDRISLQHPKKVPKNQKKSNKTVEAKSQKINANSSNDNTNSNKKKIKKQASKAQSKKSQFTKTQSTTTKSKKASKPKAT